MREAVFNTEVMNSLKKVGAWAYKIADSPTSWTMDKTRFTPDKPCDIIACIDGAFIAIEGKQIKKFEAFGMRHLRDVQVLNLERVTKIGGKAFVFLNIRIKRVVGQSKAQNRLIIFEWREFKRLCKNGSISKKDIEAMNFIPGEVIDNKIIFDLKEWAEWL